MDRCSARFRKDHMNLAGKDLLCLRNAFRKRADLFEAKTAAEECVPKQADEKQTVPPELRYPVGPFLLPEGGHAVEKLVRRSVLLGRTNAFPVR